MLSEIKLVVSDKAKIIETVCLETNTQPSQLIKSLEKFQLTANTTLTKIIESFGGSGNDCMDIEDEEDSDDNEEGDIATSPKKRKND